MVGIYDKKAPRYGELKLYKEAALYLCKFSNVLS